MKALLVAINAKYIHSNLGVYCLYAYSRKQGISPEELQYQEYTINQNMDCIIEDIYEKKPDIIGFSCYIWNWEIVERIAPEVKKILPEVEIWYGGPEVSYHGEEILAESPWLTGVMVGAGEKTFYEILVQYSQGKKGWSQIEGVVVRNGEKICRKRQKDS